MEKRTCQWSQRSLRQRPGDPRGFTLAELLVVITIIMLLVAIVVPTANRAIAGSYAAQTLSYIKGLQTGIASYKRDTGYLPGENVQETSSSFPGDARSGLDSETYTGSQVLAACMFWYGYSGISSPNLRRDLTLASYPYRQKFYSTYYYDTENSKNPRNTLLTKGNWQNVLSDGFPIYAAMPICYYLSRKGQTGPGQFHYDDNAAHMYYKSTPTSSLVSKTAAANQSQMNTWVENHSQEGTPVINDARSQLIGAGADRKNFTSDDTLNR
ncbi:MAG: prepilin-type N-terminal cleavage/methylation domain-containing protein [Phycisphaerae bacterium]|nr:prepilin-type N-terminal cleavage/methylation domain-containing protein [Phycisphaerae bacterium]